MKSDGSMSAPHHDSIPAWTWIVPLVASGLLGLKFAHIIPADAAYVLILAGFLLGGTVFAAVHHAEVLALKLGEPFGSILLAVAVTVIEAALIVSIMLAGAAGADVVARDTVFAAVMIVLNGVVGLCLVLGAGRHFEQTFQLQGASSLLAVLGTLATLALILPNFTETAAGGSYSILQLEGIGLMSLVLWAVFVFVQTIMHRDYFLDAPDDAAPVEIPHEVPGAATALLSLAFLIVRSPPSCCSPRRSPTRSTRRSRRQGCRRPLSASSSPRSCSCRKGSPLRSLRLAINCRTASILPSVRRSPASA
jgi:Ca2+:H+ antiporter